jgi:hypothetical protein
MNLFIPSYFPNSGIGIGGNTNCTFLVNRHIGLGGSINYYSFRISNPESTADYSGSKSSVSGFGPHIYFQTSDVITRRIIFFSRLGPLFTSIKVNLKEPVFYLPDSDGVPVSEILSTNHKSLGAFGSAGLCIKIFNNFNFSISTVFCYTGTKSVLYPDTNINLLSVEAGFVLKLLKDKKYYF